MNQSTDAQLLSLPPSLEHARSLTPSRTSRRTSLDPAPCVYRFYLYYTSARVEWCWNDVVQQYWISKLRVIFMILKHTHPKASENCLQHNVKHWMPNSVICISYVISPVIIFAYCKSQFWCMLFSFGLLPDIVYVIFYIHIFWSK